MKKENGLTMIALIIIVVIIGFVISFGIRYVKDYINNEKNEDIKTIMLLIQGKTTEIGNKHKVDEETNSLVGIKLELENSEIEYNISQELRKTLESIEDAELFILTQEDLNNMSVKDVAVNSDEFYIVDYNSNDIFYSLGIDGKYRLSDLETKSLENYEDNNSEVQENTEIIENSEVENNSL